MYSVLNTFSEDTYLYISRNITSYTFLLVFKKSFLSVSIISIFKSYTTQAGKYPQVYVLGLNA